MLHGHRHGGLGLGGGAAPAPATPSWEPGVHAALCVWGGGGQPCMPPRRGAARRCCCLVQLWVCLWCQGAQPAMVPGAHVHMNCALTLSYFANPDTTSLLVPRAASSEAAAALHSGACSDVVCCKEGVGDGRVGCLSLAACTVWCMTCAGWGVSCMSAQAGAPLPPG
jgi:hypothetical protein